MRETDPDLKEHVISVLRSASSNSVTDDSLQTAFNKEERQCSLLDVQQACAELVEEGRLRRLDAEKVPRSRRYELVRENSREENL